VLYYRRYAVRCVGCRDRISPTEVVRRAQQFVYHVECFTCDVCGLQLQTGDQFCLTEDDGKLVCKTDYLTISKPNSGQMGGCVALHYLPDVKSYRPTYAHKFQFLRLWRLPVSAMTECSNVHLIAFYHVVLLL